MSSGRVVVSSLTGRPIAWGGDRDAATPRHAAAGGASAEPKVLPDRMADEQPEPGRDESNDVRLLQDVPPHWGTGS